MPKRIIERGIKLPILPYPGSVCEKIKTDGTRAEVANRQVVLSAGERLKIVLADTHASKKLVQDLGVAAQFIYYLDLSCSRFSSKGIMELQGFSILKILKLNNLAIQDKGLAFFGYIELPSLTDLFLVKASITTAGLKNLAALKKLEILDLSENNKIKDSGLESLQKLSELKQLSLAYTRVSWTGVANVLEGTKKSKSTKNPKKVKKIKNLPKLNFLDLSGVQIKPNEFPLLQAFDQLETLRVVDVQLNREELILLKKELPNTNIIY